MTPDRCWITSVRVSTSLYQFIIIYSLLFTHVSPCPELCLPCLNNDLYCEKPGLQEIPTLKFLKPLKVIIQNQQFVNPSLSEFNFSTYRSMTELSIRSSNINRIKSYALSGLSSLRNVDFSDNADLHIENDAFSKLVLQYLKLDNLGIIKLDLLAFNGLSVDTLSIQNSNLLSLPYELLEPISNSITKLFLKNNQLRSLDSRLRPILLSLKILEIQDNPFICNCSLLWLSEILESQRQNKKMSTFESSEDPHPKCVAPAELRKEYVYTLVSKLKNCFPPTIIQIDIIFHSIMSAGLSCYTKVIEPANDQTEIGWFLSSNESNQIGPWKKSIKVSKSSSLSKYKCKAQNAVGNSEIDLLLSWSEMEKSHRFATNDTFKFEDHSRKQSFLWEKVFSLFEMICAILGTLVITVILFFLFCCFYAERSHFLLIGNNKRKLQAKNYPSYERGVYSDARIYCETDMDVCPFPPPPPPTPPPLPATRLFT